MTYSIQVPTPSWLGFWDPQFLIPLISGLAIERLGGHKATTEALAYLELHQLTGQQGRLRHVECLEAGEWIPSPAHNFNLTDWLSPKLTMP